ncbi:MAG: 16S rRNA (adenine(1518)-N(6)/adenine(1519)-N(6))-dimethyltransferase RsmA [Propionibacteriaceae bacterium]|nr:16S rRNA (adenine(1518)-N(6)/adenine(1519)-N(6))-dimethyltransferase RsmA [Propionibacteriaceae bacterium]
MSDGLLDPSAVRVLAASIGLRPSKHWGQNFVVDANTVRRLVGLAGVKPGDAVLEVGPGLGSLTLGLLAAGANVTAVEIDPALADLLGKTVAERMPQAAQQLVVIGEDALRLERSEYERSSVLPQALVANLPYNVAVPVILHVLAQFESIKYGLVMVQLEVARRLTAAPGSRVYGVPSAKLAWFADVEFAGTVPPRVFWPVPNVESGLVRFTRREVPSPVSREKVFAVVDAAFAQRRKMLRSALANLGDTATIAAALDTADVAPTARGETLNIEQFAAIAQQL